MFLDSDTMSRCLNCSVAVKRMARHNVTALTPYLQNRLSEWLSGQELSSDGLICQACFVLLNKYSDDGTQNRVLGYPKVCIGCGRSVMGKRYPVRHHSLEINSPLMDIFLLRSTHNLDLRISLLACHPCFLRATRQSGQNLHRQVEELQDDEPGFPEPPPCPPDDDLGRDQRKVFIAKVFHYLKHEFEVFKKMNIEMILSNLSKLCYRTAKATGVSETTVLEILKEEAKRSVAMREDTPQKNGKPQPPPEDAGKPQKPAQKRRRVCKKPSQADSITIDPEVDMFVVKAEPVEYYNEEPAINIEPVNVKTINREQAQLDPISLDMKWEPPDDDDNDEMNDTNETPMVHLGASNRRKMSRKSDHTSTHEQDQTDPLDVKVEPPDEEMNGNSVKRVDEVKAEYVDNDEEGFS